MGIQSFTTYMNHRSAQYFEKYRLENCNLVIDCHSVCNKLYNWEHNLWRSGFSSYCYGGDYDKYANIVKSFFQLLLRCNVTPYMIFDGCNENDKVSLIKKRLDEKVKTNSEITPVSKHGDLYHLGSSALRYAFKDVVIELQLKSYTCLDHANRSMASLANHLKCPVLSADSDFFILGAMYIPFSTIKCQVPENGDPYINCELYKMETLINNLNRQANLPYLLPVLLGNNQFNTEILKPFYRKFKIFGRKQEIVKLVFKWLSTKPSFEMAIREIVKSFPSKAQRCAIFNIITTTISKYTPVSITPLLEYFDLQVNEDVNICNLYFGINLKPIAQEFGVTLSEADNANIKVGGLFEKKIISCQYPACFIDMLNNRYFVWPNIEDCSKPDANTIGYEIMAAIHNILVQTSAKPLTVLKRIDKELEDYPLPLVQNQLPSIEEIEYILPERRQQLIFEILKMDKNYYEILNDFPKKWHLFLLSLLYSSSKSQLQLPFIYSLIICFITLNYVDLNLGGFYRSVEDLPNRSKPSKSADNSVPNENDFPIITREDSVIFMHKVIKHFEKDNDDNAETYDRIIMHSMSEFQCVFLHLKFLNALINYPFEDTFIYNVIDGSFIYNMTKNLRNNTNINDYSAMLLQDCSSIEGVFKSVIDFYEQYKVRIMM